MSSLDVGKIALIMAETQATTPAIIEVGRAAGPSR
jgi:hypothetical protein